MVTIWDQARAKVDLDHIFGFRDYQIRQEIFQLAPKLRGTEFYIREDFPAEIRSARGQLWEGFKKAKADGLRAKILYPAKLFVEGQLVEDTFPAWGQWTLGEFRGGFDRGPTERNTIPRSGTPMNIPIRDLIGSAPRHTQNPRSRSRSPRREPDTSTGNLPPQGGPGHAADELITDLEPIPEANETEPKSREAPLPAVNNAEPRPIHQQSEPLNANTANGGNNAGDNAHFEPPPQPPPRNRQVRNQNAAGPSASATSPIRNQNRESDEGSPEFMSLPEVISNAMELTTRV